MPTNKIGVRTSNVFLPYTAATKRTKQYAITVTSAQSGWAAGPCSAVAYADSTGKWRLTFNLQGTFTAATVTQIDVDITGIVFASTSNPLQACSGFLGNAVTGAFNIYAIYNTSTIRTNCSSTSQSNIFLSGEVALASEPTWAAANMEGALPVDVYIPSASAAVAGIVDNAAQQLGSGIKTVSSDGLKFANATGSYTPTALNYYEEGSFAVNFNTGIWTTTTAATAYFTRVGKIITLCITGIVKSSDTTSNYFGSGADVPARLRPIQSIWNGTAVYESSNFLGGFFWVSDGGLITFQKNDRSNFAATGNGFPGATITYRI